MKIQIAFLVFLLSSAVSAASFAATTITLDRTNKLGLRAVDILEEKNGHYFVNGRDLGNKLPANIKSAWQNLLSQKNAPAANCASGSYVLKIKSDKSDTSRRGCTEGTSYGALIQNLETIRNFQKPK